ncbi:cobalt ABC transporter ATP-binding protein, partial [Actinomycetospora sp. SF1]|nr:cobalt ABC transporter ATP-binding protein [Actinomycetospora soli]
VAMRPRLLVLDEPTAGLDPAAVEDTLTTLGDLHAAGTTIVLSTHDVDLAHRWADEIAVVTEGTVRSGSPDDVLVDLDLLASARLGPAWAPAVRALLRRHGLEHLAPRRPSDALEA